MSYDEDPGSLSDYLIPDNVYLTGILYRDLPTITEAIESPDPFEILTELNET